MENKKKKIGIDIDEVLSEFVKPYLEFHNKKFGTNFKFEEISKHLFWDDLGLNTDEIQDYFDEFQETHLVLEDFPLLENAKESIELLSKNNKVFVISSRPKKLFEKTKKFIKKNFPENNFEVIFSGEVYDSNKFKGKDEICKELEIGFLIEDSPEIAIKSAEKGIKVFLLDKPWNKNYQKHENITKVKNWREIMERLG